MQKKCFLLVFTSLVHLFVISGYSGAEDVGHEVITKHLPVVVKLFGAGGGNIDSYGTAVLISAEGHVLTVWNHLVSDGRLTAVTADGRRFSTELIGTNADYDAAVLKLRCEPGSKFAFIDIQKAADVGVGSSVFAFSNMFRVATGNEPISVVRGVVAAKVPLQASQGRWKFPVKSPVFIIDAITNNSGAAGGLLTDSRGNPVGLIGREIRHASSRVWVNYAVPFVELSEVVRPMLSGKGKASGSLTTNQEVSGLSDKELTSRFGLTMVPDAVERTPAFVDRVVKGSASDKAGIRRNDLIVLAEESVVSSVADLRQILASFRSGERITIAVNRNQELLLMELQIP